MIGRYTDTRSYKELLKMEEFYRVSLGSVLIISAFFISGKNSGLADILALMALLMLGGSIVIGAIHGLLERQLNVDELVSLAIVASAIIGEYLSAAVVALIMVLGSLCEKYTSHKARTAINSLISLSPEQATIIRDGIEIAVPASAIKLGDHIIVRSGDQVPVDGIVVRGFASFDQASLTGESLPVEKQAGDLVFSGTVNYSGMVEVEAQKLGEDTTLGRLIKLVQDAENSQAPILRITDRYARFFTPAIILVALLVYFWSGDLHRAITVLIVGCPCAFILAAPTAVISALGNASQNGILVKGGALLEEIARINMVIFDKTGTLTTGVPTITSITPLNGSSSEHVLLRAASSEKHSAHPLGRAIVALANEKKLALEEPDRVQDVPGMGVEAIFEGHKILVGGLQSNDEDLQLSGQTKEAKTLAVKENDALIGLIQFQDTIRPEVDGLINSLHQAGVSRIQMLSGDDDHIAGQVANISGIDSYRAGLLPREKLELIKEYQQQGCKVAMVGDGINDAPALAAADVGIAMGAMGAEAALEAADIALMSDDLTKLNHLIGLGRTTVRTIHAGIIFAVCFNLLSLLASGLGYLNPITGALAHNVGSVLVVLNSARLIRYKM